MLSRFKQLLLIVTIVSISSCSNKSAKLIPIGDFFNLPDKSSFHISPDGKYVSYISRNKGKQCILIQTLANGQQRTATTSQDYLLRDYFWTYNNKLILTNNMYGQDNFEMYAIDAQTMKMDTLLTIPQKIAFRLLNRSRTNPDMVTFSINKRDSAAFDVYKMNIKTRELKVYIKNPGNITEWFPDADGKIRLAKTSDGVNETILFRQNDDSKFRPIIVNNFKNLVEPVAFTGEKNYFYALSNVNRDKTALVVINAENGKEESVVYDNANADLQEVFYSKNKRRLDMVGWEEAKPKKFFLNNDIKAIYNDLLQQLPNNEIKITDRDSSEKNFIVTASNDRNPGSQYLYSVTDKKLTRLSGPTRINPADLCEMKPISFKASDGTLINGYLTLPLGKPGQYLPVIVMPHSDPWRRDSWGYNVAAQFLANRGYGVFQVNYRGSTGYGKAFYSAGFKQVGGKMQDDITDGVKWLIDQKIANPQQIGIYGMGFGGFSALYGASFHPDLYHCAAVQSGLINFFTFVKDVPPFFKPYLSMVYEKVGNPETDADMFRAISPIFNADKIKTPLLIYQDAQDRRVNMSELNQFVRELKRRKVDVNYVLVNNGKAKKRDHNQREANRVRLYTELEKFLSINLLGKK